MDFTQLITIHYQTFTAFSIRFIKFKAPITNNQTLQFIQSINHKLIHILKTIISNVNSFQ